MKYLIHIKSKLPLWYLIVSVIWWLILGPFCAYHIIDFGGFNSWFMAALVAVLIPIFSLAGFVAWIDDSLENRAGSEVIYEYKIKNLKLHLRWRRRK